MRKSLSIQARNSLSVSPRLTDVIVHMPPIFGPTFWRLALRIGSTLSVLGIKQLDYNCSHSITFNSNESELESFCSTAYTNIENTCSRITSARWTDDDLLCLARPLPRVTSGLRPSTSTYWLNIATKFRWDFTLQAWNFQGYRESKCLAIKLAVNPWQDCQPLFCLRSDSLNLIPVNTLWQNDN